ncbi:sensor domain-containing diguanylate cyclase [Lysobacter auxotrophicus]|uniref:diguanylate cyclase n=1 Tax=Lysobacter auxotrophicus TaxID=2992573 RepID=A0ABM8DFG3_9GAMM|nr:GGDEF domain-containing protein [Lysobacter auxotrophicus]BDU17324.1 GGDEF domain-containing protein [Lysobacter auxotrophicus]
MTSRFSPLRVFLAATVILVSLGLYVVANAIQFASDYRMVTHTYDVLRTLDHIESLKHQAVAESRGYLLAGRADNRDNFWRIGGELQREADLLAERVVDNPPQHERAVALRRALDARLRLSVQAMQSRTPGEAASGTAATIVTAVRSGDADVARRLEQLRMAENQLLSKRSARAERSAWLTLFAAGVGIPLSLMLIGYAQRRLARENRDRKVAERAASASNTELNATVEQLARLSDSMAALSQYSGMLQGASDAQELYEITATTFRQLLPGMGGLLYVIRASRDHAELVAQWGGAVAPNDPAPALQACWSVRRHAPFAMEDLRHGLRCSHIGRPHGAEDVHGLCVPLSAHGEVVGWLSLQGEGRGRIPDESLAIRLCEQLSLALANVRLRESLRHQAVRDPLTGLFNRRYLEESLAREIARCQRRGQPLAVLMLDVDHFKLFNDRHGHAMGDAALSAFARMLKTRCRPEDIACRYGGEEFTLILPETDLATALERAEDIRAGAAMLRIGDPGASMLRITVSIGVALMPEHGDVGLELMRAGDQALYRAKHEGRDRVAVADGRVAAAV